LTPDDRRADPRHVIAIGVQTWGTDVAALRRYWAAADALGFARVTYGDGLWDWTHDGWTLVAALAVETRRCRVGPAVTYAFDVTTHPTLWLAKRAVAVDHLSGGRLDVRFAVGAEAPGVADAWRRFGITYPPPGERIYRLEAAIAALRRLWAGEPVTSLALRLRSGRLAPSPVQRPGPPIWVAAMGPRAMTLAARHADGWEASFLSPDAFAKASARLDVMLDLAGRARDAVRRSVEADVALTDSPADGGRAVEAFSTARGITRDHRLLDGALIGDAETVLDRVRAYARAGATDLMLGFTDFPETTMLERFAARVLPALRASGSP
jgi:alkanesulfonate monooxygenase SsuD/methylene tetrahydromethanopterin reductase-like flavin-dependent oxidoreductase (luciferase family)